MKKSAYLITTLFLAVACGPSPEEIQAREQAEKDSLVKLESAKQAAREATRLRERQDSIRLQFLNDSLNQLP